MITASSGFAIFDSLAARSKLYDNVEEKFMGS